MTLLHWRLSAEIPPAPEEALSTEDTVEAIFGLLTSLSTSVNQGRKALVYKRFKGLDAADEWHKDLINTDDLKVLEHADKIRKGLSYNSGGGKGKGGGGRSWYRYQPYGEGNRGSGDGKGRGKGKGKGRDTGKFSFLQVYDNHGRKN